MKLRLLENKGFTLIEIMAAMVLLTVALLGMLQSVNISMEQNAKNSLRGFATAIAEQQVNDLQKLAFDEAIANQYTTVTVSSSGINKSFRVERTKTTLTARSPSEENSYSIRVNVRWSFKNVTSNHSVTTVVSR